MHLMHLLGLCICLLYRYFLCRTLAFYHWKEQSWRSFTLDTKCKVDSSWWSEALRDHDMKQVCTQLSQLSQVVATGSMTGSAHLTLGLAACSAAQVGGFLSCLGFRVSCLAADAEKLYLLTPEQQQEPLRSFVS